MSQLAKTGERIEFERLDGRRVLVRMPRVWWLYLEFRRLFPRAKPAEEVWTFVAAGKTVLPRLGRWDRRSGDSAAAEVRRREQARRDAEWEAASAFREAAG